MKIRNALVILGLCLTMTILAQPNAAYFNTGWDATASALITAGNPVNNWKVSKGSITGTYTWAYSCVTWSGWATPPANAGWITYPHTCSSDIRRHECITTDIQVDEFYKIEFTLPDEVCGLPVTTPNAYCLNLNLNGDNCVYAVYVNNTSTAAWNTSVPAGSVWGYTGYSSSMLTPVSLCSGWVAGTNTVIVHVKSGTNNNSTDITGFLCVAQTTEPCDPQNGGCCLGNQCGQTQNPLPADYEIPMNSNNFYFSGDAEITDKVNVGYNCNAATTGKLNSYTGFRTNANPLADVSPESAAIYGLSEYSGESQASTGVMGEAVNREMQSTSIGVWGRATGAVDNIGGKFYGGGGNKYNIGVSTVGQPSTGNPLYSYTTIYPSGANIGVYAAGIAGNSGDDGGPAGIDWAGWFDGDVKITGNCWWNSSFQFSDKRLKKDIQPLENMSSRILKLNGYTYKFRSDEFKERGLDGKQHIGLIAQELKDVFPELVTQDAKGIYAVDYIGMIPVLLESLKDQIRQNSEQQKQLEEQKQLIEELSRKIGSTTGVNTLSEINSGFQMSQNEPNPFTHETIVNYTLPQSVSNAYMAVYDLTGKQITTFAIDQKGSSSITITSEKLAAGIYIYSIVADGKALDSKRMIVSGK